MMDRQKDVREAFQYDDPIFGFEYEKSLYLINKVLVNLKKSEVCVFIYLFFSC